MNHVVVLRLALRSCLLALLPSSAFAAVAPARGGGGGPPPARSAPPRAAPQDDEDRWSWRIAPYLWMTDIQGDMSTRNLDVELEVEFSDIWDNLGGAGLLLVEANRGRLAIVGDLVYLGLDLDGETPTGMDADADVDTLICDLAGLYRLSPTSPFELGLGLRYADVGNDLEAGLVSADIERDALDGVVAGRASVAFAERWSASLYGDVGAGDSDLTWQASALLGLQLDGWGVASGYRAIAYDFEEGSDELDLTIHGLVLGVEFRF